MGRAIVWTMLVIVLGGGDCRSPGTPGKRGNYYFTLQDPSTLSDIGPVAAGGVRLDVVTEPRSGGCTCAEPPPYKSVVSTDPTVATVAIGDDGIDLVSGVPGTTELQLLDDHGGVLDSVDIVVETPAVIANTISNPVSAQVLASDVNSYRFDVTVEDAMGVTLAGGAQLVAVSGAGVVSNVSSTATYGGATIGLVAQTAGSGAVTVTAGDATSTLAITAVDASAVTGIDIDNDPSYAPSYNANDQTEVVWVVPRTADGQVFGGSCAWQVDPSVKVHGGTAETLDGNGAAINNQFVLPGDGPFPATCTIGNAQLTVQLHR